MTGKKYIAIIDLGSNSFNLIIAKHHGCYRPVIKRVDITVQLASYLDAHQVLSQAGIQRCADALEAFVQHLLPFGDEIEVRANATYTIRSATNQEQLLAAIAKVFPYPINILTGEQEAATIYRGITLSYPRRDKFIAIDIGGGSTEVIFSADLQPVFLKSHNLGCVSFTQEYFATGEFSRSSFNRAVDAAKALFAESAQKAQELGFAGGVFAVGSSGTVKTALSLVESSLGNVERRVNHYLEQSDLPPTKRDFFAKQKQRIELFRSINRNKNVLTAKGFSYICDLILEYSTCQDLIDMSFDLTSRKVLVGGLCILKALFESFGFEQLVYSNTALREGTLYADVFANAPADLNFRHLADFRSYHQLNTPHFERVLKLIKRFNQELHLGYNEFEVEALLSFVFLGLDVTYDYFAGHAFFAYNSTEKVAFSFAEKENIFTTLSVLQRISTKANKGMLISSEARYEVMAQLIYTCLFLAGTNFVNDLDAHQVRLSHTGARLNFHLYNMTSKFFYESSIKSIAKQTRSKFSYTDNEVEAPIIYHIEKL